MASRPVQAYPLGFLSLLGLKNLGKLPDVLPDFVQPTFDLQDWYLRGRIEALIPLVSGAATGGLQALTIPGSQVPEGETWYIQQVTASLTAAGPPATYNWWVQLEVIDTNGFPRLGKTVPLVAGPGSWNLVTSLEKFWMYQREYLVMRFVLAAGDIYSVAQTQGTRMKV